MAFTCNFLGPVVSVPKIPTFEDLSVACKISRSHGIENKDYGSPLGRNMYRSF